MQEEYSDSTLSISQRAYLIARSLHGTSRNLIGIYIIVVIYLSIGILSAYSDPQDIEFFKELLPFTILVSAPLVIWSFSRSRVYSKNLEDWSEEFLDQSYVLIFETTLPKGNSTGEKVLNLARQIFPELRPDFLSSSPYFEDHIRWYFKKKFGKPEEQYILKSLNYKVNSYSLDLALKTTEGYFIVKDFKDKVVTLEDLKQLVKI